MLNLVRSILFGFVLLGTGLAAQGVDLQRLLQNDPDLKKQIDALNLGNSQRNDTFGVPTSQPPQLLNSNDLRGNPALIFQSEVQSPQGKSVLSQYFSILTGQVLRVYGADEFRQTQDENLIFFNTTGQDYRLAAGDVLRVTLRGFEEVDQTVQIGRDGFLVLSNLPPIQVSGHTIGKVEERLLDILRLDDASASAYLALDTARLITVQVSGNVNAPRTLAVPAYTPLSRIFSYAGGIADNGSLRNVILSDRNGEMSQVDFYEFLQNPLGATDPVVVDNARVFVGDKGATLATTGFVARPGIYELPKGETQIAVTDLLKLSGTSFVPPGAVVEALYFDEDGTPDSRPVTLSEELFAGEALRVRFVETRDVSTIQVRGAVIGEYSLATTKALPVKDVLKNASVLKPEALLNFALIMGPNVVNRAIDLEHALLDPAITIPAGATLYVFEQSEYRALVSANPNDTVDPLAAAITQAEVAEIYLNGERLAYIPPSDTRRLADAIRPFYAPTPQTVLDFALIQRFGGEGQKVEAISLRDVFSTVSDQKMRVGDRLFVFEKTFYQNLLKTLQGEFEPDGAFAESDLREGLLRGDGQTLVETDQSMVLLQQQNYRHAQEKEKLALVVEVLSSADVIRIELDDEIIGFLPFYDVMTLGDVVDILGGLPANLSTELAFLTEYRTSQLPTAVNLGAADFIRLKPKQTLHFMTGPTYRDILGSYNSPKSTPLLDMARQTELASIYVDGQLVSLIAPHKFLNASEYFSRLIAGPSIYPLYANLLRKQNGGDGWRFDTIIPSQLLDQQGQFKLKPSDRVDIYTTQFVRSNMIDLNEGADIEQAQFSNLTTPGLTENQTVEELEESVEAQVQLAREANNAGAAKAISLDNEIVLRGILSMRQATRSVTGAVQYPGLYPVAGEVSLSDLIDAAGGVLEGVDETQILITGLTTEDGRLLNRGSNLIDLTKRDPASVRLKGQYFVNVPFIINDAVSGSITINGEVERPGTYVFGRSETLHDVLKRAGGLTKTAYPLGAVFFRESAKKSEAEANDILAGQVEASILSLASSDVGSAGDQINAVLGFSKLLREQEVVGRLAVNVLQADHSVPVYLEDKDILTIPKRPSHVSVIGSVNRNTMASYAPEKRAADYVAAAGGVTRVADQKRTYILLPNGESMPLRRGAIIPPGAVLVVPPKVDKLSILGLTDVIARVLGNIATSVLAINNVN
ncbi:SLBB domain-containing protein [Planktomarina temperata]|nr:SLBB domain-containing protein [Planktomarina temperata]